MKIAVMSGGGDSAGMNAFIRGVTRIALSLIPKVEVIGIIDGWKGLIHNRFRTLKHSDVAGIIHDGGTILGTMRAPEFKSEPKVQEKVAENLLKEKIDVLIVHGGNGSLKGCLALENIFREKGIQIRIFAAPGSIDNDVANRYGYSIGFHSAIEQSNEMLSWIRDTASSHRRVFIIKSMGAKSAYLAFFSGVFSGCEYIIRPRENVDFEKLADMICERERDTRIVVSEAYSQSIEKIKTILSEILQRRGKQRHIKTVDMGYFQRGGQTDVNDMLCASWLAYRIVKSLKAGEQNGFYIARYPGDPLPPISLKDATNIERSNEPDISKNLIEMAQALR